MMGGSTLPKTRSKIILRINKQPCFFLLIIIWKWSNWKKKWKFYKIQKIIINVFVVIKISSLGDAPQTPWYIQLQI
jgi:hypothetical protein